MAQLLIPIKLHDRKANGFAVCDVRDRRFRLAALRAHRSSTQSTATTR